MITKEIDGKIVLYADEGKVLTNGSVTTTEVWVGDDEWHEIDTPESEEMVE